MTAVVRYTAIANGTGQVLTVANADAGDDFSKQIVKRTFVAADIGTGSGQTRDTTSNPTLGCLVAQFTGSRIMDVNIVGPCRGIAGTHVTLFNTPVVGTGANTSAVGWNVIYNALTGISSVYILDTAAAAPGQIAANDWIYIVPLMGNSASLTPAP